MIAATAAVVALSVASVPTKQGVNFHVATRQVPLYVKLVDFLHRHWQYRLLAQEITRGCATDTERALAVLAWTHEHIKPTPKGWPIVDDHILHIIIRGHGVSDQMADVFATLATYAGVEAFWKAYRSKDGTAGAVLSFARIDGRWVMFDVARGVVFRDPSGGLASVEQVVAHPEWLASVASAGSSRGVSYTPYLSQLLPLDVPKPLRAVAQMPWPRLWYETQHLFGVKR